MGGKMMATAQPKQPDKANFVICCDHGDWSGFRTLDECKAQFSELENMGRPNFFYWVEER
jgi:hypothetical protein